MSQTKSKFFNFALLLLGVFCISWSAIFVKLANVSGIASGFYRMFFGSLVIVPLWFIFGKRITDKKGIGVAILCGALFAADIALWNTSIMLSKASISTLLANLAPIWVGIGALMFMKEKPAKLFWWGTLLAMVGVIVMVVRTDFWADTANEGNLLAIFASMFYGAYLLMVKLGRSSLDTFSFTAISMVSSVLVLGLISCLSDVPMTGFEPQSWWSLVALGLIPQVLGWILINQALGHISPTVASVTLLSQTVLTTIISAPVLGEFLTWKELFGSLVVLAGIFLVNSPKITHFRKEKSLL